MAGKSSRFFEYGFKSIKYKLPIDKNLTPMIEKAIKSLDIDGNYLFVTRDDDFKYGKFVKLDQVTEGPACTVDAVSDLINDEEELIVANCDQILEYNSDEFLSEARKYDGCVMTYDQGKIMKIGDVDKNSYIAFNPIRLSEKIVISDNPLTGIHYFKKSKYFKEAYKHMVSINRRAPNGEFYLSLVYQSMVDLGFNIGMYKLNSGFYPVGEPNDYFDYLYTRGGYENITFKIPDEFKFGTSPVRYVHGKIFVNETEINIDTEKGWIIGNFEPSMIKTSEYELGILSHKKGEKWDFHYHSTYDEINLLYEGTLMSNGRIINKGEVFINPKNQIACPKFIEDCKVVCVKIPSTPGDKHII